MLRYAIKQAGFGSHDVGAFNDGLTILTGEAFDLPNSSADDRVLRVEKAVEQVLDGWWTKSKGTMTTDLSKMSDEQRRSAGGAAAADADHGCAG